MSKIDKFNNAKATYGNVKRNIYRATGKDDDGNIDSNNDKACLYVRYNDRHAGNWNDAILCLHASHGFYGSSSGYSSMDKPTAEYMVMALNKHIKAIAEDAIKFAEADMEKARKSAEDEARLVLLEVREEVKQ